MGRGRGTNRGDTRIEFKKRRADERKVEADKRTPAERLKRLDDMFGENKGATKERAKLQAKLT